ncbi:MAG: sigma-70 family RNA polymerase sigma factor [Clostridium sp.]|uniref:sigma-70 family RNA polymerase sigma factor n=1 Tax=Clostridium sp. TaxID=1506 RepID=UPI0039EBCCEE
MIDPREHIGLAKSQAGKLYKSFKLKDKYSFEDILQQCYLSLVNAAKNFDETTGNQFSTYAYNCIHHDLFKFVSRDKFYPYTREERVNNKLPLLSLDAKSNDHKKKYSYSEIMADTKVDDTDLFNVVLIRTAVSKLSERYQKVITLIYFKEKNKVEVARMFGVTPTSIARWEKEALTQLKQYVS